MKTYFKKIARLTTVVALSSLFIVGCKDKDKEEEVITPAPVPENIVDKVIATPEFSFLEAAVIKAGLVEALKGPNLTVFAPDNNAFIKAGFANEAAITATPAADLARILQYHVVNSVIQSTAVPAGPNAAVTPLLANSKLFATRNSSGVFINGTQVTQADITASNGVIHKVGSVLLPPALDIVQFVVANPNYARLEQAVIKCGLVSALSATGPLTVFAPNNAAFVTAGFDSTAIANANPATVTTLTNVLTFHVFNGRAFSSDITNGGTIPTLFVGNSLTTNISASGVTIKGAGNGTSPANITAVNIVTTNGVIHAVDKVLLP